MPCPQADLGRSPGTGISPRGEGRPELAQVRDSAPASDKEGLNRPPPPDHLLAETVTVAVRIFNPGGGGRVEPTELTPAQRFDNAVSLGGYA
jgi:hypothetical protein